MTNLADLLPAGGGQNNTEFVADGNISAGAPVILTSDGKAAPISGSSSTVGAVSAAASSQPDYLDMASSGTYLVAIYKRSSAIYARAGTVSGSTITWGTELSIYGGAYWSGYPAICYDSTNDKFIISWTERDATYTSLKCSPLTVNAGPPVTLTNGTISLVTQAAGTSAFFYNNMAYSPDTNHFVIVNAFGLNSFYGVAYVGQHDGASGVGVNGTGQTFNSVNSTDYTRVGYDESADRFVITYLDSPGGYSGVRTGLAAGSSTSSTMTFGTEVQLANYGINVIPVYDSSASKTVLVYKAQSSNQGEAVVATVGSTTITLASTIYVWQANSNAPTTDMTDASFDSNLNQVVISWREVNSPYYSYFLGASVSGEVITYGASTVAISANTQQRALAFNSGSNLTGIFAINSDAGDGSAVMVAPTSTNLTSTNLLGLAPSAISDTATGTINTWGSRCENNDFFGTVSATYGSPTAASAYQSEAKVLAYDSANNRFVMAYKDGSNSDYGTAVVGELSGTSITWGTPVVFESATTGSAGMDIAFDSNVNRIVIAYQDQGNSSYGTAIVGSVSGTGSGSTIAFGSPTIFESADTRYLGMTFDSNDNRIVIVYSDAGNSFYATYVIGTVTTGPDAISFNTPALLNGSSGTYEIDASFDATENKVLVAYTDTSYDLYVLNLAISSGSGTPGTASSFGIGSPQQRFPRCVYDSVNGKSGVAYAEGTNLPIYFSVISMSGSNVTIETRVLAGDTSDSNYFMHNIAFDASIGQLAICTRDASASKGIAYYGSISGTTSSWTTSGSLFADETILTYGVDVAYDTSANKLAFVYSPSSGSDSAAVVGTLATTTLTIGTDYYVQTDGTLSTDTGGQLIGNAIKTNQINIKDYTG